MKDYLPDPDQEALYFPRAAAEKAAMAIFEAAMSACTDRGMKLPAQIRREFLRDEDSARQLGLLALQIATSRYCHILEDSDESASHE